jgi:hypothetical protein
MIELAFWSNLKFRDQTRDSKQTKSVNPVPLDLQGYLILSR